MLYPQQKSRRCRVLYLVCSSLFNWLYFVFGLDFDNNEWILNKDKIVLDILNYISFLKDLNSFFWKKSIIKKWIVSWMLEKRSNLFWNSYLTKRISLLSFFVFCYIINILPQAYFYLLCFFICQKLSFCPWARWRIFWIKEYFLPRSSN